MRAEYPGLKLDLETNQPILFKRNVGKMLKKTSDGLYTLCSSCRNFSSSNDGIIILPSIKLNIIKLNLIK
jgi:hypothetical protein